MVTLNMLIREGATTYRVVRIDGNLCFLFARGKRAAMPERRWLTEIREELADGRAEVVDEDPTVRQLAIRAAEGLPADWLAIRDRAWGVIRDLVESEDIFYPAHRWRAIVAAAQKHGVSPKIVLRWLRNYWRDGMTPDALLPRYWDCGPHHGTAPKGERRKAPQKRGPKSSDPSVVIGAPLKRTILAQLRPLLNRDRYNFSQAWRVLKDRLVLAGWSEDQLPSDRQVRYLWKQHEIRDPYGAAEEQHGSRVADLEYGAETSSPRTRVRGPGYEWEIDATPSNVWVIDPLTGNALGRPTIYLVLDVFSSLIAGFYLTLDAPRYMAMSLAILNAAMNKADYGRDLGIPITAEEWPSVGLPRLIRGDRGSEMMGYDSDTLAETLGVKMQNTVPRKPKLKPFVESANRRLDEEVLRGLPGYVHKLDSRDQKQYEDPRLTAALTLPALRTIIVEWIVWRNASHVMTKYPLTPAMIRDNVRATPAEIWQWGLTHGSGGLRVRDPAIVRLALMPQDIATVSQKGIGFRGMTYTFDGPEADVWFRAVAASQSDRVKVRYDPDLINVLFVVHKGQLIRCHLTDIYRGFAEKGVTHGDMQRYKERRADQEVEARQREDARRRENAARRDALVQEATNRRDALAAGKSKADRRRGDPAARQRQQDAERREREAQYPPPSSQNQVGDGAENRLESQHDRRMIDIFSEEDEDNDI